MTLGRVHRPGRSLPLWTVALAVACGGDSAPTTIEPSGAILETGVAGRWPTAPPEAVGLDRTVLEELEAGADRGDLGDVSSVLVLRNGVLVFELYRNSYGPEDLHPVFSVTKSVTSLLVGAAVDAGLVTTLDRPILDFFPQYSTIAHPEGKEDITLQRVLEMRTGLEWDELSTNYSESVNPVVALAASPDWIRFVLDLPLAHPPGSRFAYNSGVSMLMAGVLGVRTGMSAEAYGARILFEPLGITSWEWEEGPGGLTNSGWGLSLRPRDMAAIGQLVLQEGSWDGEQLIPGDWLARSQEAATRFVDGTGYGFQWWLGRDDGEERAVAAWGYGDQFVVVIPRLSMVLVTTAENFAGGGLDPYGLADFGYRAGGLTPP